MDKTTYQSKADHPQMCVFSYCSYEPYLDSMTSILDLHLDIMKRTRITKVRFVDRDI